MIEYNELYEPLLQNGIIVIEVYARWCGTCRQVSKAFSFAEQILPYTFVRVDSEKEKLFLKKYHIQGVPVVLILKDGVEVDRKAGSLTQTELQEYLNEVIKSEHFE